MLVCASYEHIYCTCIVLSVRKHDSMKTEDEVGVKLHVLFLLALDIGSTLRPLCLQVNGGRAIYSRWRPGGVPGRSGGVALQPNLLHSCYIQTLVLYLRNKWLPSISLWSNKSIIIPFNPFTPRIGQSGSGLLALELLQPKRSTH
jgi:hypothetical protein